MNMDECNWMTSNLHGYGLVYIIYIVCASIIVCVIYAFVYDMSTMYTHKHTRTWAQACVSALKTIVAKHYLFALWKWCRAASFPWIIVCGRTFKLQDCCTMTACDSTNGAKPGAVSCLREWREAQMKADEGRWRQMKAEPFAYERGDIPWSCQTSLLCGLAHISRRTVYRTHTTYTTHIRTCGRYYRALGAQTMFGFALATLWRCERPGTCPQNITWWSKFSK